MKPESEFSVSEQGSTASELLREDGYVSPDESEGGSAEADDPLSIILSDLGVRALKALLDDYERGGNQPLTQSHVDRVLEKRDVLNQDVIAIIRALAEQGVEVVDDLADRSLIGDEKRIGRIGPGNVSDLGRYIERISRAGLLTAKEEVALGRAIAQARRLESESNPSSNGGSERQAILKKATEARRRLVEQNIRLVVNIAKRYITASDLTLDDLVQEGTLGLMRAVEKFDHQLGYRFSTYATWWIMQSVTRALADTGKTIRLPVHMMEQLQRVKRARRLIQRESGDPDPHPASIAAELGVDIGKVHFLIGIERIQPLSLDAPSDEFDIPRADLIPAIGPSPEQQAVAADRMRRVQSVIGSLKPREQMIIKCRFGIGTEDEWSLDSIGRQLGLTRERIRQIEEKTLRILRKRVEEFGLSEFDI